MIDHFPKYEEMKRSGSSPDEVYRQAIDDKVDLITRIRMIRSVFGLSPGGAKEVVVRAAGESKSLDQHQEKIANELIQRSLAKEGL